MGVERRLEEENVVVEGNKERQWNILMGVERRP